MKVYTGGEFYSKKITDRFLFKNTLITQKSL